MKPSLNISGKIKAVLEDTRQTMQENPLQPKDEYLKTENKTRKQEGIAEVTDNNSILVYPNPVTDGLIKTFFQ